MDVFGGAPRFLAYPRTYTVPSGADAVLKCQIAGDPRPTVIWERDQTRISPSDRYHFVEEGDEYNLVVRQALLEDSGQYICKAKNPVGETYAAATLRVEEGEWDSENRPVFLVRPSSARVGRGDDVVFMGQLTGKPAPSVSWEKDGKKLSEIFESAHFSAGGQGEGWHHLKLFGARPPDAGVYLCRASNTYGEAMAAAVLLVDPAMEALTPTPSSSSRQPSALGLQNGEGQEGNRPHRERRHRGRPQERRADPGLERGPGAEDQPHPTKVRAFAVSQGKHAKFRCLVTGKPKPEIVWRKDGRPVTPDRRHLLYEDREGYFNLKVLYCKQRDRGLYTCAASNAAGQTLSSVLLHIKEPRIKFQSQLQDVEVKEREQAVLECEVPAESVPATWFLEDRKLQPSAKYVIEQWGTRRRLTIKDITMDDDGIYLCQMKDGGRSIAEVAVKGKIVKRLPRKLDVVEGENAAFCVDLDEDNVDVRWYKDGEPLSESHKTIIKSFGKTHILVFVNATLEDAGVVTFVISESKSSSQLRVKPKRQTVPGAPENARLSCERPNTASLVWSPPGERGGTGATGFVVERQELGSEEWVRCLTTEGSTAVEILGESVPAEARYRFRVCAVNKHGRGGVTEFPGAVHLVPVARIRTHLNDTTVCQEEDAEFAIELTAPVIGTWHMKGRQLQEGERISIQQSRSQHSLLIRRAKLEENEVEVTFVAHGVRDSAILFVKAVPLKVSVSPGMEKEQRVTALESIVLSCELSRPSGQVRWVKDGEDLEASDRISLESCGQTRRLIVQSSQLSDSGQYTCDATDDSITFCVTVSEPPVKIVNTADDTKAEYLKSDRIVLNCELSRPSAEVKWYKNGLEVEGDANIVMVSHGVHRSLIIQSARIEDSGEYVCDTGDDSIFFDITVREPRATLRAAEDGQQTRYLCGETVVLNCEVSHSDAEVKWYKDSGGLEERPDVRMESEGVQRRLVIPHCSKDDSGVYVCETTGDSLSFTVTVTDHPVTIVSSCPSEVMVPVGAQVILWCQLSWPQGLVRWSRDGAELEPSERCRIEVEEEWRRLIIHPAMVEDQGTYVCHLADAVAVFKVTVSEPRATLRAAEDGQQTRYLCGETVVLNCEVSHSDAEVKWYKDSGGLEERPDVRMESEGVQRRLVIPHCSKDDSGVYVCETTGDSLSFTVTVTEPPVCIIRSKDQLLDHKFLVSEEIRLECELSRADAPAFWYKDGEKIAEDGRTSTRSEGTVRSLQVLDARLTDSGEYLCDAQDDSIVFRVLVVEPPVRITRPTDRLLAHKFLVSENIHLECEVSRANALAHWFKDGEKVAEDRRTSTRSEGTVRSLQVLGAQLTDSGEYLCDVRDDSIVFRVLVEDPPVTILGSNKISEDRTFTESEVISMTCELSRSDVKVRWYRDGVELLNSDKVKIESRGLTRELLIFDSEPCDSGQYVCDAGSDKLTFKVTVAEAPVLFTNKGKLPEEVTVNENGKAVLAAIVSKEKASVTWYRHKEPVSAGEKNEMNCESRVHSLILKNVQKEDSGFYVCRSADDEMTFNVSVIEFPLVFVRRLENTSVQRGSSVTLWCELNKARGDVVWLKDGAEVEPSRKRTIRAEGRLRSLTLSKAAPEDEGEYACESKDDRTAARVSVSVPRVVEFISDLHNLTVLEGEVAKFKCVVSPEDVRLVWRVNGADVPPGSDKYLVSQNGLCHTLLIRDCRAGEVTRVTAEAEGLFSKASLQVQEAQIVFTKKMVSVAVEEFQDATFEVEVSCGAAEVQWMKQGVVIQAGPRFLLQSEGRLRRLTVLGTTVGDRGTYRCETLHDRTQGKLSVEPRRISLRKSLVDLDTFEKEAATFHVELSHPNVEGVWVKDGIRVKPCSKRRVSVEGTRHSLTLSDLMLEDTGTIAFQSNNIRCSARLTVREPPVTFMRQLKDLQVPETTVVTLECELSRPNVEVRWYKDDTEIKPNKSIRIYSMGRKRVMQLGRCGVEDSGIYSCDAGDNKTIAKLEVYEREVRIVKHLEDLEVRENDNAVFVCEVSHEGVKGEWLKDGERIKSNNTAKIRQEGTKHFLLICKVKAEDAGEIRFTAKNVESTAHLDINELPIKIVKPLRDKTALEKHKVILECKVSKPRARVRWYRGDEELQPTDKYEICSEDCYRKLVIHNVSFEDEDTYTCDAFDDVSSAKVLVEEQAILMVKDLEDVEVRAPGGAEMECEVSVPVIRPPQWTLNSRLLQSGKGVRLENHGTVQRLVLSQTSPEMSGLVKFTAGKARSSARLTIKAE
ncbi:obscurin-like protein 1a isoform X2 [Hemitrygon akajei]|uniref:obscurin-like protein 1a isoform X2 n=1 Tax=Hemitrygon akajei TaxID=2704970 RepID=UPI003BFA146C